MRNLGLISSDDGQIYDVFNPTMESTTKVVMPTDELKWYDKVKNTVQDAVEVAKAINNIKANINQANAGAQQVQPDYPYTPGSNPPPPAKKDNTGLIIAGSVAAAALIGGTVYMVSRKKKKRRRK